MLDEQYKLLISQMRELESDFDENRLSALYGMIDLYSKLRDTNYHDITDSIELWVDHFPEAELLKYIAEKNDSYFDVLVNIIRSKQAQHTEH